VYNAARAWKKYSESLATCSFATDSVVYERAGRNTVAVMACSRMLVKRAHVASCR